MQGREVSKCGLVLILDISGSSSKDDTAQYSKTGVMHPEFRVVLSSTKRMDVDSKVAEVVEEVAISH